jgi:nitrite reductase/ring-hydroxylating ferredoxin subunit
MGFEDGSLAGLSGVDRQRATMRDLQRRMVAHMAAGNTTDLVEAPQKIPVGVYTDPVRAEAEFRALFLRLPLVAGLSCDVPGPGDAITFDAAGVPVLVMRGKDGVLRAFRNACRHRAARLVKDCHKGGRVTCPFHGWTYDTEGKLVGVPGKVAFEGLDVESVSLQPIALAEWHGLVLVRLDGEGPIDAEAFFGPMADEIRQLGLENVVPVKKARVDVAANWKFAQDTFFEGYHFNSLHPSTIAAAAVGNVMVHDAFGPHQRVMMPYRFFQDWVGKPESEWGEVPYQGIHLLFPNTVLYVGNLESLVKDKDSLTDRQIFGLWRGFPDGGPDRSFTLMATYRPASQSAPETVREYEELTDFIVKVVSTEDYSMCADGQRNMRAMGPDEMLILGRNEGSIQSIHAHVEQTIAQDRASERVAT